MTIKLPKPKGYFHEWTEYGKEEKWQAITCQFDHFHEDDEVFFTETQPREWQELSEHAKIGICNAAEKAMGADKNLPWRMALIDQTNAALRAKNGC